MKIVGQGPALIGRVDVGRELDAVGHGAAQIEPDLDAELRALCHKSPLVSRTSERFHGVRILVARESAVKPPPIIRPIEEISRRIASAGRLSENNLCDNFLRTCLNPNRGKPRATNGTDWRSRTWLVAGGERGPCAGETGNQRGNQGPARQTPANSERAGVELRQAVVRRSVPDRGGAQEHRRVDAQDRPGEVVVRAARWPSPRRRNWPRARRTR